MSKAPDQYGVPGTVGTKWQRGPCETRTHGAYNKNWKKDFCNPPLPTAWLVKNRRRKMDVLRSMMAKNQTCILGIIVHILTDKNRYFTWSFLQVNVKAKTVGLFWFENKRWNIKLQTHEIVKLSVQDKISKLLYKQAWQDLGRSFCFVKLRSSLRTSMTNSNGHNTSWVFNSSIAYDPELETNQKQQQPYNPYTEVTRASKNVLTNLPFLTWGYRHGKNKNK